MNLTIILTFDPNFTNNINLTNLIIILC
uniref:Uncharacterized protein n=1 Tax=Arundo donax TaxID=35708 RepID=A0A0A9B7K8_ARUDO